MFQRCSRGLSSAANALSFMVWTTSAALGQSCTNPTPSPTVAWAAV